MHKLTCKTTLTAIAAVLALLLAGTANMWAQQQPAKNKPYLVIDYMKILPGKAADANQVEREIWGPIHQERVKSGKIDFWRVYQCQFPSGSENEYDYVTITQYPSFAELDAPYGGFTAETLARIHPSMKLGELTTRTEAVRKLVREDVVSVEQTTSGWPGTKVGVLNAVYVKTQPGRAADLDRIERDFFLPLFQELVKQGHAAAWAFTLLRFPSPASSPYDSLSLNGYESLAKAGSEAMPEAFEAKWKEANTILNAARVRVRVQLWGFQAGTRPK